MIDLPPDCYQALNEPIMQQIYQVESSGNPFAIGVVNGRLIRQPKTIEEAVSTANDLASQGRNYSIGKGQINKVHFERLGWTSDISKGFNICENVKAAHEIYNDCFSRAKHAGYPIDGKFNATHAALSCYYSGSFKAALSNPDVTRYVNLVLSTKVVSNKEKTKKDPNVIPLANNTTRAKAKVLANPNSTPKSNANDWIAEGVNIINFN